MEADFQQVLSTPDIVGLPETLLSPETLGVASGLINHELKMLGLLYVASLRGSPTFGKELNDGFIDFLGSDLEHDVSTAAIYSICSKMLLPSELVEETTGVSGYGNTATGFNITDLGTKYLPLAGAVLDWSFRYPDISTQQILGGTQTAGRHTAARNRLNLLLHILTAPSLSASTLDIADNMGYPAGTKEHVGNLVDVGVAVRALEQFGTIDVRHNPISNDQVFEIISAEPPVQGSTLRGPITSTLYSFLAELSEGGRKYFDLGECTDFIIKVLGSEQPQLDPAEVRAKLYAKLTGRRLSQSNYRLIPGVRRLTPSRGKRFNTITVPTEYQVPLRELAEIIIDFDTQDETALANGKKYADDLMLEDLGIVRSAIAEKGYSFSLSGKRQPRARSLGQVIMLLGDGAMDAEALRAAYNLSRDGQEQGEIMLGTVRVMMAALIKKGLVTATRERTSDTSKVTRLMYVLTGPELTGK